MDANLIISSLSILLTLTVTILGWMIHRKTEQIKIMEGLLSDKKYKAYSDFVTFFYSILKSAKTGQKLNDNELMEMVMNFKKEILLYGSDEVFFAFNDYLKCSMISGGDPQVILRVVMNLLLAVRYDMCANKSKVKQRDILISLIQDEKAVDSFLKGEQNF